VLYAAVNDHIIVMLSRAASEESVEQSVTLHGEEFRCLSVPHYGDVDMGCVSAARMHGIDVQDRAHALAGAGAFGFFDSAAFAASRASFNLEATDGSAMTLRSATTSSFVAS
jgi:hypothetical protein